MAMPDPELTRPRERTLDKKSQKQLVDKQQRLVDEEQTLELREEQLVPHREMQERGHVRIRRVTEDKPARLEVEARSEEVEVVHEPVGKAVSERQEPWEDGDDLVVPIYEEQLVVTKRLVLREHLRIRRVESTRRELFEDTVRREKVAIEDSEHGALVHERYPTEDETRDDEAPKQKRKERGGLTDIVLKALE